jgi:hypothetical protein
MSLRWRATDVPLRRRIDFADPIDGAARDHFPRRDTSMEKLARLKPAPRQTAVRASSSFA